MNDEAVNAVVEEVVPSVAEETVEPKAETAESVKSEVAPDTEVKPKDTKEEKPKQSAEDNAKFAETRRRMERESLDKAAKKLQELNGWDDSLGNWESYEQAIKDQQIAKKAEETGVDAEYLKKMEKLETENLKYKEAEERQKGYVEFQKKFPNVAFKEVPQEIWTEVQKGGNLRALYTEYKLDQILMKQAEAEKVEETNKANAEASTGSVKGKETTSSDGYVTQSEFDANKTNQSWMDKNWNRVMKSWKDKKLKST